MKTKPEPRKVFIELAAWITAGRPVEIQQLNQAPDIRSIADILALPPVVTIATEGQAA